MSPATPSPTVPSPDESLDRATRNLSADLRRLLPESVTSAPLKAEDLGSLMTKLMHAAECFHSLPPQMSPSPQRLKTISDYRKTIELLAQILPQVRGRLLAERSRIEHARAHLAATAAWAQASAKTF